MPSRVSARNENLAYSGDIGHGLELRKCLKHHQTSRFAKENPLSPRSGQNLKFKDKARAENLICPPNADQPLEFVKNDDNIGFVVQTKSSGDAHQPQLRKSASEEEELIRYMSKVPGFLQRGQELQDNILNFGVLDWGRLEKWRHKQNKVSASERTDKRSTGSCSRSTNGTSVASATTNTGALACPREQPTSSRIDSSRTVDCSPVVKPISGRQIKHPDLGSSFSCSLNEKETNRNDQHRFRDGDLKSVKGKEKYLDHWSSSVTGTQSSKQGRHRHKLYDTSKTKISTQDTETEKRAENFNDLGFDTRDEGHSAKHESIFLLLPKDFSRPGSSEMPARASLDGKQAEFNWGSFSDIFSVDEIQSVESLSDIAHSCPLPYTAETETETELDLKLDNLIKAQGVEYPLHSDEKSVKAETSSSSRYSTCMGLDQRAPSFSAEMTRDRFSFSLSRMTRSLSFKEGSGHPQLGPTYMTAKSGPAKPEGSAGFGTPQSNKANTNGRTRNSTLRRLLDPLLKNKASNQIKDHPNDLRIIPENERCEDPTIKAILHLTAKSGLPLFKFVVEAKNEILASTVKSLSTFGKNDSKWLYTFYSVQQVRKKSGGWKNHKVKTCGFSYNVIGQMKVSNPHVPNWCGKKPEERYMVRESVLYSVDLSTATSEFMTSTELAAIVVKVPDDDTGKNDRFSSFEGDGILGSTVVILPGGIHSLPDAGEPSPLIKRWRTGGSCDCGGWDVGCKLRILTNTDQQDKSSTHSRSHPMQVRCDLFEKGEAKQRGPLFTLVPFRDGLFSVEFDAEISSLQAFSVCVAVINSHSSYTTNEVGLKQEFDRAKESMALQGEGPEKHAPHPPLSPVGRV